MLEVAVRPKKRIFLALIIASLLIAALSVYGLWRVSMPGLANISEYLPLVLGGVLGAVVAALTAGIGGIILAIIGVPTLNIFHRLAWTAINIMFPLATSLGRFLDIDKERVERSFIELSNHLVKQKRLKVPPNRLLVLTPHCLQLDTCPHKITRDVNNCRHCGACQIGELKELTARYGVHFSVVTGGTLARNVIKTLRPKAVLAIACERDLTSGIQDIFPLPVVGVLNERPQGPCCNTRVDLNLVEKGIREFLE